MARIVVFCLYFMFVTGQVMNKNDCEEYAMKELDRVKNSFVIPTNFSLPPSFDEIHDLLKRLNKLVSNMQDLNDIRDNQKDSQILLFDSNETDQLKKGIESLKSIHEKIELMKTSRNRTTNECKTAKDKFDMLIKDFSAVEELGSEINRSVANVSKDIEATRKRSILIQSAFQSLIIPDFTVAKYLCSTRLAETLGEVVLIARRIKNTLLQQKEEVLSKLKDVRRNIGTIERSRKEVPSPILEGGDANSVRRLREKVTTLRNEIDKLKRMKSPVERWNGVILKLEQQLKEDIENAKEIKNILAQRKESEKSYSEIVKIVQHLCERGVCTIREAVHIEP